MSLQVITSDDTLTINNRVFADFADDDVSSITMPNNMVEMKTGKNGNTIYSRNAAGDNGTLTVRLMRGSSDDQFMQGLISAMGKDFVAQTLLSGSFVKRIGDGASNVIRDVTTLRGGMIQKKPETKENVAGATDQGVAIYTVAFAYVDRSIE